MNPLDLRGPSFLAFYLVGVTAALLVRPLIKRWLRGPADQPMAGTLDHLSPYAIAYLSGGANAAIDAALTALAHRGMIELDTSTGSEIIRLAEAAPRYTIAADGVFRGIPREPDALHPLERDICAHLTHGTTFLSLRKDVARSTQTLEDELVACELMRSRSSHRTATLLSNLLLWALMTLGVIKLGIGVSRGRPVIFLLMLIVVTFVVVRVLPPIPRRTRLGDAAVDQLMTSNAALGATASSAPEQLHPDEAALACALFGAAALGGSMAALGASMAASYPTTRSWGSGDGSFSCGASCGGGCGGGCGGCGGCGV